MQNNVSKITSSADTCPSLGGFIIMAAAFSERRLALITYRENALNAATDEHGKIPDAVQQEIHDEFNRGFAKLAKEERKATRAGKKKTDRAQEEDDLQLSTLSYSSCFKFPSSKEAKAWLKTLSTDWVTAPFGHRGANPTLSYHGARDIGAFMIKSKVKGGEASVYECEDNEDSLVMPDGAIPLEAEEVEGEEDDDHDFVAVCT